MKPKKLIFSLAALWGGRTNDTNWKYENALTLLDHIKKRNKMDVFYGFELGNEIYGHAVFFIHSTSETKKVKSKIKMRFSRFREFRFKDGNTKQSQGYPS